jgi:hypothetical protein
MLPSSARIFHGRITGIVTNPGEKAIGKAWFWVVLVLTYFKK